MGDEKTTQTTTLPEKTDAEKRFDAQIADVLLPAYMDQLGYDMRETTKTVYDNPARVESLEQEITTKNERIAELEAGGAVRGGGDTFGKGGGAAPNELDTLYRDVENAQNQLGQEKENSTQEIGYDYELTETGEKLQAIREKAIDYQAEAADAFMGTFRKFMSGDYSITADQEKLIQDQMASVREPVMAMLDEVETQYERTGQSMGTALNQYIDTIKETGLTVGAALNAVGDQIKNTKAGIDVGIGEEEKRIADGGQNVLAALTNVRNEIKRTGMDTAQVLEDTFTLKKALVARDMQDLYDSTRIANAEKAARIGRSPLDPRFQVEMQAMLNKQIERAQLQLGVEEASMMAGLRERTGQRMEQYQLERAGEIEETGEAMVGAAQRRTGAAAEAGAKQEGLAGEQAALAERTGQRTEEGVAQKMAIAERTGAGREAVAGQKAAMEEGLQTTAANLRQQYGVGIPASQIGLGMDVGGFQQAVQAQQMANTGGAIGLTGQQAAQMQAERMAQPTTTTVKESSPIGTVFGALGGLAGGAGSIMGGIGSL